MEPVAKYAYQVYQKGSFTKAAKALYLSQPSLSAAISKLEEELGFRVFDRSTLPCSLTKEGRIYIEGIEEIMECEDRMRKRLKEAQDVDQASIVVGGTSFASYLVLTRVCEELYRELPDARVTLDIGNASNVHSLREKLENREIDIFVNYNLTDKRYVIEPIAKERLVIAMHKKTVGAEGLASLALTREELLTGGYDPCRELEDLSVFRDVPFLEFHPRSDTGQRMARMLGEFKTSPCKIQNAKHSEMHYNLMCAGVGAAVVTTLAIEQKPENKDILFFMPRSEESYRTIYFAYHHTAKSNRLIRKFVDTAKRLFG